MNNIQQLELGFNQAIRTRSLQPSGSRLTVGRWWFAKMRQVVATAVEVPGQTLSPYTASRVLKTAVEMEG